jgi:hypothetical protein
MLTLLLNPNILDTTRLFVFKNRSARCLLGSIENGWHK